MSIIISIFTIYHYYYHIKWGNQRTMLLTTRNHQRSVVDRFAPRHSTNRTCTTWLINSQRALVRINRREAAEELHSGPRKEDPVESDAEERRFSRRETPFPDVFAFQVVGVKVDLQQQPFRCNRSKHVVKYG